MNTDALKDTCDLNRVFRCWLEEWKIPLLKNSDCVAEARLLEKYKDMSFYVIDDDITYTIFSRNLEYQKGRGGGWCVLGMPPQYDRIDDDVLEPWMINDVLIEMIKDTEQPKSNKVKLLMKDNNSDDSNNSD